MAREYVRSEGGDWEIPDPGLYTLRYVGEITSMQHPPKKPGEVGDWSIQHQFVVDDPDSEWDGVEVRGWFPEKVTDRNKTGKLFAAMFGGTLPDRIREEELVGKRFKAMINVVEKNGREYPSIESPVALGAGRRRGRGRSDDVDTEPDVDVGEPGF